MFPKFFFPLEIVFFQQRFSAVLLGVYFQHVWATLCIGFQFFKNKAIRKTFLGLLLVHWLRLCTQNAGSMRFIPGQEDKYFLVAYSFKYLCILISKIAIFTTAIIGRTSKLQLSVS